MQNDMKKPELIVIAGPNGSGKSTVKNLMQFTMEYVNADNIKADTGVDDLEAAKIATERKEKLIGEKKDFAFETVLSTDRNLKIIEKAKNEGYFIRTYYIITKDPGINVLRVAGRVEKGGHFVPKDKILSRYDKSIANLKKLVELSDVCNVYDNSNSHIKRFFKRRKAEYFYQECKQWNHDDIKRLTDINDMKVKDLNI